MVNRGFFPLRKPVVTQSGQGSITISPSQIPMLVNILDNSFCSGKWTPKHGEITISVSPKRDLHVVVCFLLFVVVFFGFFFFFFCFFFFEGWGWSVSDPVIQSSNLHILNPQSCIIATRPPRFTLRYFGGGGKSTASSLNSSTGLRYPSSNHCHNWIHHRSQKPVS